MNAPDFSEGFKPIGLVVWELLKSYEEREALNANVQNARLRLRLPRVSPMRRSSSKNVSWAGRYDTALNLRLQRSGNRNVLKNLRLTLLGHHQMRSWKSRISPVENLFCASRLTALAQHRFLFDPVVFPPFPDDQIAIFLHFA